MTEKFLQALDAGALWVDLRYPIEECDRHPELMRRREELAQVLALVSAMLGAWLT
jgi:hypothetical protein